MATTQTQLKAVTTDEQDREQTPDVDRLAVARIVREAWTHDPLGDFHPLAAARECSTATVRRLATEFRA